MAFPPHAFMFQPHGGHNNDHLPSPTSLNFLPSCPPLLFHGGGGGGAPFMMKRTVSFSGVDKSEEVHGDDELSDDGSHLGEKKSSIWNKRARWKTKQLEKDYDALKKQFEALKADNDALQAQNMKLNAELLSLSSKDSNEIMSIKKENEGSWSHTGSDNSCDVNLDISRTPLMSSKHLFPRPTTSMTQLLQDSSRPDLQCLKLDQVVQEESFCNMFNGADDQQGFWPWSEHQNFH
ncbi:putative receptor-like protein kinase [Hibiscus syriacus]|uniref:Homeobox-leucine zipper protein n=1 Tax=Hibiscus syriacus TaxID=106335 RepID=A0A6A2ZRD3_HIBSY|nr:putative receptor-like protein kinase [Hibiscus syriacus]